MTITNYKIIKPTQTNMKNIIQTLGFLFCLQIAKANSVTIKLFNNSNATIHCSDLKIHNGDFLIKDHGNPFYGKVYAPGSKLELNTGSADAFCGTDGYVEFQTSINNKTYQFLISFDNPFIGSNEFYASASSPFVIKHLNGGGGSDMVLSYELTGGPSISPAPPPPPPINIPQTGNKSITGTFTWSINDTGLPSDEDLTKAFDISVKAPTQFVIDASGKSNNSYQNKNGYFNEIKELKNISITYTDDRNRISANRNVAPNPLSPQRVIRYTISNLPDNIPLSIHPVPVNIKWNKGKNIPDNHQQNAKWIVFILEKNKTDQAINYNVAGGWFDEVGNAASDATGGLKKEMIKGLKSRRPQSDFGGNQEDYRKKNVLIPNQSIERKITIKEQNGIERQNMNIKKQNNIIKQSNQ
ncbi:MAG TPA: hypothetical protein PLZ98_03840 [Chitinophagaceae bacterium]|nr:hypothetical protein [Chitinophagaceae bacterium]